VVLGEGFWVSAVMRCSKAAAVGCASPVSVGGASDVVMMEPVMAKVDQRLGAVSTVSVAVSEDFGAFYARDFASVVGLARVLTGSQTTAEDLAQEAFVAAYRRWVKLSDYDDPGAWVRRVVANRSVSLYRRRLSEAKALLRLRQERSVVAEWEESTEELWRAVRRLPRRQAQVIVLRYLDGQSVAVIAVILRCSQNTVKTHLLRARKALAVELGKELGDEHDR
jgi:RNA polymerase sigma-70 factor (ECF subfamily)